MDTLDRKMEEDGTLDAPLMERRKELLREMEGFLRWEDIHWNQKAKCMAERE